MKDASVSSMTARAGDILTAYKFECSPTHHRGDQETALKLCCAQGGRGPLKAVQRQEDPAALGLQGGGAGVHREGAAVAGGHADDAGQSHQPDVRVPAAAVQAHKTDPAGGGDRARATGAAALRLSQPQEGVVCNEAAVQYTVLDTL